MKAKNNNSSKTACQEKKRKEKDKICLNPHEDTAWWGPGKLTAANLTCQSRSRAGLGLVGHTDNPSTLGG